MEKLRILLAGIGGYGALYLDQFLDVEEKSFELCGVADPFAASSPRFAELKARSVPVYQSPDDFFAERRADLAVISSPIHTHYPYILSCFKNGCSALCEKPVTASLAEMDELIAKERETGLFVAVGFQLCFSRAVLDLKKDILGGVFGRPLEFRALNLPRRGTKYYRRNGWAGRLSFEGRTIFDSPLQNACSHELQNMLFLLGSGTRISAGVKSVEAELWQGRPDIENFDAAALRLTTENGVKLHFYTAHCIEESTQGPVGEYRFEKALVRWGEQPWSGFTARFDDGRVKPYDEPQIPAGRVAADSVSIYQKLYDAAEAVRSGEKPSCTLETARPHLQCVTEVQRLPVIKVPQEKLARGKDEEGDDFYYVPGLRDAFFTAYRKGALPSETGFAL